jgi:hypothetical protein
MSGYKKIHLLRAILRQNQLLIDSIKLLIVTRITADPT